MNEREQKKKPEVMRWVLIGVLLVSGVVAVVMQAKADHLINDEPSLTREALARPADMRVLMLGNSLIYKQSTDVMLERLAASTPGAPRLVVGRIARPWFSLYDHYKELYADDLWHRWNVHNKVFKPFSDPSPRWDALIIHEQSGWASMAGVDEQAAKESASSGTSICMAARDRQVPTILMASWGYMGGARPQDDAQFRKHFPDFKAMNQSIDRGYTSIVAKIEAEMEERTRGDEYWSRPYPPIKIARVGRAFEQTWELDAASSRDPLAQGSLFRGLYDDPNHPSLAGAYLSAAVLLVTLTGQPCGAATWVPDGLDPEEARRLRALADAQLSAAQLAETPDTDAPPDADVQPALNGPPPAINAPLHRQKGPPPTRPQTTPHK
jgi:hypothetical protein